MMENMSRLDIAYQLGRSYRRNNTPGNPYKFEFSADIEELSAAFERGYHRRRTRMNSSTALTIAAVLTFLIWAAL
jgi:hypothetical protein